MKRASRVGGACADGFATAQWALSSLNVGGLADCERFFLQAQRRIAPLALKLGAKPGSAESGGTLLAAATVLALVTVVVLALTVVVVPALFVLRLLRPAATTMDQTDDNSNNGNTVGTANANAYSAEELDE